MRDALWALVSVRLDAIERGLVLVAEGIDCSAGQTGLVDGLARDANGAPVLLLVATDTDGLLPARTIAACDFLQRVGDAFGAAVPEGNFCAGRTGRVIVVSGDGGRSAVEMLRRLPLVGLEACRLEAFRIGGAERFAVRWLRTGSALSSVPVEDSAPAFEVPAACRSTWDALESVARRIDPAVAVDGGRFSRRITWRGRLLGEVVAVDGELRALGSDGIARGLAGDRDVRSFADSLVRRHAQFTGLAPVVAPREAQAAGSTDRLRTARAESLRESMQAARISNEERNALTAGIGGELEDDGTSAVEGARGPSE
ncbi:MAG: hypothetical protein JNK78_18580 [Planctomycetes bacterium]|nr:hypothetical protein [Planctomycetota bacterium]